MGATHKEVSRGSRIHMMDQFIMYGVDKNGKHWPKMEGWVKPTCWGQLRKIYQESFPEAIHISVSVALPDTEVTQANQRGTFTLPHGRYWLD